MPVQMQHQTTKPNDTVIFNFDDTVLDYMVGIAYWSFTFGDSDHHVNTVQLSISSSKPTGREIHCSVFGKLQDHSGHHIDEQASSVTVVCVAQVGGVDENVVLANVTGIADGGISRAIQLPSGGAVSNAVGLSGFNLSYKGGDDHHVREIQASVGFERAGTNLGHFTGHASLSDNSGHHAAHASVNGSLVSASALQGEVLSDQTSRQQTKGEVYVDFPQNLLRAVAMIKDMTMRFSGDHHIQTVGAGCTGWTVSGSGVTLRSPRAFMSDKSGNHQVDEDSHVTMTVIAAPA
jgi:hypothetical protein